jgi:hypothetical protein
VTVRLLWPMAVACDCGSWLWMWLVACGLWLMVCGCGLWLWLVAGGCGMWLVAYGLWCGMGERARSERSWKRLLSTHLIGFAQPSSKFRICQFEALIKPPELPRLPNRQDAHFQISAMKLV